MSIKRHLTACALGISVVFFCGRSAAAGAGGRAGPLGAYSVTGFSACGGKSALCLWKKMCVSVFRRL